jgi:CDGSH-type Zn-finger protein
VEIRDRNGSASPISQLKLIAHPGVRSMSDVTIRVRDHGPLLVEGPIQLVDAEGNAFPLDSSKPAIALCRCGGSQKKPFCDGSHRECGFQAAERGA